MNATRKALAAGLAALSLLAVSACGSDNESGSTDEVEVFTWWAEGSEKEAPWRLLRLPRLYLTPSSMASMQERSSASEA